MPRPRSPLRPAEGGALQLGSWRGPRARAKISGMAIPCRKPFRILRRPRHGRIREGSSRARARISRICGRRSPLCVKLGVSSRPDIRREGASPFTSDFSFFHRIQRAKAPGIGHAGCLFRSRHHAEILQPIGPNLLWIRCVVRDACVNSTTKYDLGMLNSSS